MTDLENLIKYYKSLTAEAAEISNYQRNFELTAASIRSNHPDKFRDIEKLFSEIDLNTKSMFALIQGANITAAMPPNEHISLMMSKGSQQEFITRTAAAMHTSCVISGFEARNNIMEAFGKLKNLMHSNGTLKALLLLCGAYMAFHQKSHEITPQV